MSSVLVPLLLVFLVCYKKTHLFYLAHLQKENLHKVLIFSPSKKSKIENVFLVIATLFIPDLHILCHGCLLSQPKISIETKK